MCNFKTCTLNSHPSSSLNTPIKSVTGHEKYIKLSHKSTFKCTINNSRGDDGLISVNVTCRIYQHTCMNKIRITNSSLSRNSTCLSQGFEIDWEDSANTQISFFDTEILAVDNFTLECIHSLNANDSSLQDGNETPIGVTESIVITASCILAATAIVMLIFRKRRMVNTSVSADSRYKSQDNSIGSSGVFKTSQYCLAMKFNDHESSKNFNEMESRYCGNSPKLADDYNIKTYNSSPPIRPCESTTQISSSNTIQPAVCGEKFQQSHSTETDELKTQDPEQINMNQNVTEFYDPKIYYYLEIKDD